MWHGFYKFILIWSTLNFICVHIEQFGKYLWHSYQPVINTYLSESNQNRLTAMIGAHLFIPAAISNFYFFAGIDVGNQFMLRTYITGHFFSFMFLYFCCYCIYHISEMIKRRETAEKIALKKR